MQSMFARHDHAHLELTAALPPEARRMRDGGGAGPPRYSDHARHAADLRQQATQIRLRHRRRIAVLGVDPDLVLILDLNRPIDPDGVSPRDLYVLAATDATAMVAFANDPALTKFLSDLDLYAAGPPTGQRTPPLQGIFDAITGVREIGPDDVIDDDLRNDLLRSAPEVLRLDVEYWCPEDGVDARRRYEEVAAVVARVGEVVDRSCRPEVGFSVIRADVPAGVVRQLADTTRVRRISRLPRPELSHIAVRRADVASLPVVRPGAQRPAARSGRLRGSSRAPAAASGRRTRQPISAAGRVLSIRVLDHDNLFPDDRLWQKDLAEALLMPAERGARVVNLSLGDDRHPYRPSGPVPVAAVVDEPTCVQLGRGRPDARDLPGAHRRTRVLPRLSGQMARHVVQLTAW